MNSLKNVNSKWVIAGLGTLAVFGSFIVAVIFYAILQGLGVNEDLTWALSMLAWIAVVVVGIFGAISFYNSVKNRVEQVTVIREVVAPQAAPQIPVVSPRSQIPSAAESRPFLDEPERPTTLSVSHRPMLSEGDNTDEPDSQPFVDEPVRPTTPSVSYRSVLSEGDNTAEPDSQPFVDEPERPATSSGSYRSVLSEGDEKDEPDSQPFVDEPERPATSSGSYRSVLSEGDEKDEPDSQPFVDEPERPATSSGSYRSILSEGDEKDEELR